MTTAQTCLVHGFNASVSDDALSLSPPTMSTLSTGDGAASNRRVSVSVRARGAERCASSYYALRQTLTALACSCRRQRARQRLQIPQIRPAGRQVSCNARDCVRMGRLHCVSDETAQGARAPFGLLGCSSSRLVHGLDIPSQHTVQGSPPQAYRRETARTVPESRVTSRRAPARAGRVFLHSRGPRGMRALAITV